MRKDVWFSSRKGKGQRKMYDQLIESIDRAIFEDVMLEAVGRELKRLCRMASDIDAGIACLEGLDDWQADELAKQATIRKRAVEKRIRDLTEGQP